MQKFASALAAICLMLAGTSVRAGDTTLPSSMPSFASSPDWDGNRTANEKSDDVRLPSNNPGVPDIQRTMARQGQDDGHREEAAQEDSPGRDFRQITGPPTDPFPLPVPVDPFNIQYPLVGTPQGGYYYGFFRGPDGKIFYGKLYVPQYGDFDGQAHNNPCPNFAFCRCLFYGSCPIYYLILQPQAQPRSGDKIPVQSY